MANQVVAAQMIPRLGVPGLASPPPGRLPSHLDLLRLLHHQQHYNLVGFQGMGKICCKIEGKTHKARCQEGNDLMVPWDECRTGCIEAKNPCLLAQIKHNWEIAHLPINDLQLEHFVNTESFLLFEHCGWSKEDLAIFGQPCSTWETSQKFTEFCDMVANLSLLNDNVER